MNGKQAKRLRRAALGLGVTLSQSGKEIAKDGYVVKAHNNYSASSISSDPADHREGVPPPPPRSYQLLVRQDSVKGIYKKLKRGS